MKNVFVIMIFCPGCPINGIALGLLDGALVGVSVQNINSVWLFVYVYLGDTWFGLVKLAVTGWQKKFDVTNL